MKTREIGIAGLLIVEPDVFEDSRGYFFESYNEEKYIELGIKNKFVQDNQSRSTYGVIRGLHTQDTPHEQAKLVRVLEGNIYDVAIDTRKDSPTFGKWFGIELSADNRLQLMIPGGFLHGFSVLSEYATVLYKCDEFYHKESESGVRYDDPDLNIYWKIPAEKVIVSPKDAELPFFREIF